MPKPSRAAPAKPDKRSRTPAAAKKVAVKATTKTTATRTATAKSSSAGTVNAKADRKSVV